MLVVVGPVEELCKFGAVRLGVYRSLYFDAPIHGLVYSVTASLGFASLENLFYVFQYGPEVMLLRDPLATLGRPLDRATSHCFAAIAAELINLTPISA
jgi:RsiW-degrading membrane proteinase PrsW (M82 family)